MNWDTLDLHELGQRSCYACEGSGARLTKKGEIRPCSCALRSIFRACYEGYRQCVKPERRLSQVSYRETPLGKSHRGTWSRKEEEYIADFETVSRRHLDEWHYKVFRYHFLLGADWRLCRRKLGIDKGSFFHVIYRIEQRLGRVFFELEPYALYPPYDYFTVRLPGPIEPTSVTPDEGRKPPPFRTRRRGRHPVTAEEGVSAWRELLTG